jgi:hypothetical protein
MEQDMEQLMSDAMNIFEEKSRYEELSQPELMERLEEADIKVTTQTLRNWERSHLIIPPRREGGRGGKKSFYCEYVLAECYAANTLLQEKAFVGKNIPLPRISAEALSQARKFCKYYPNQYPCPPIDKHLYYHGQNETGTKVIITDDGIRKVPGDYNALPADDEDQPIFGNYEEKLIYHYSQFLQLIWFRCITEGCEKFLQSYKAE